MKEVVPLGERLAPDTIAKLERAAQHRCVTAEILRAKKRRLAALYLYGFSSEICLCAAYYRSSGLPANTAIDRDTRRRRMAQARQFYQEANDQNLLPYAVLPMARRGEVDPGMLNAAMLQQGGFALEGGKVDLRFPTRTMAQEAHRWLCDEVPKGYWSMVESGDAIS